MCFYLLDEDKNNFLSTKQEVEKLMNRVRSADQDQKPPGQWSMEGYLYVQEKRECYSLSDTNNEQTEGQTVYGLQYQTLFKKYNDKSRIWFSCVFIFIFLKWPHFGLILCFSCSFILQRKCQNEIALHM